MLSSRRPLAYCPDAPCQSLEDSVRLRATEGLCPVGSRYRARSVAPWVPTEGSPAVGLKPAQSVLACCHGLQDRLLECHAAAGC